MQELLNINVKRSDNIEDHIYNFEQRLNKHDISLPPLSVETLQVNITKQCNQACRHCHVDASPKRNEHMDLPTINKCLEDPYVHSV